MKSIIILSIALLMAACNSESKPKKVQAALSDGAFKSSQHQISEFEHVTVFDMPDHYLGSRCWVWVNEKTNTSHMKCDDSFGSEEIAHTGASH